MREARCETPGMRIPLLGGYRSSKRLADLWREYSLSSVVFENIIDSLLFYLFRQHDKSHRRSDDIFRHNNLTVDATSIAFPLITMEAKSAADLANESVVPYTSTRLAGTCFG